MESRLLATLLTHLVIGILVGWGLLALLLVCDIGGLRGLIATSAESLLGLGLLAFGFAVTFGGLAVGTSLMEPGGEVPSRQKVRRMPGRLLPAPVRARRR